MINRLSLIFRSKTAKDSIVLLIGSAVATGLGFFLTVILTRSLTPATFGLFITALTFSQLVTDLFELGINPAVINFVSSSFGQEKAALLKTSFLAKLIIALLISSLVFLLAPWISTIIFKSETIIPFIKFSALGIFLLMLLNWGQTVFQAEKRFVLSTLVSGSVNFLRVLAVVGLIALGIFNSFNAYLVLQAVLILSLTLVFLKEGWMFLKTRNNITDYQKIARFGLPIGLGFSLAAIYSRLDQILLFNIAGEKEAGIYGLALRVMSALIFAAMALSTATTPRFASLHPQDFRTYFKKALLATSGLGVLSVGVIITAPIFFLLLFGSKFQEATVPFQILMIGAIFFIITSPFNNAILYKFKKPRFSFFVSIFSLVLIWFLLNFLIPLYKSSGAAAAVTIVYGLQLILSLGYFFILDKKERKNTL